ncbi:hypothetical protein ACHAWF_000812 [Thalassiosira exigua]
MLTPFAASSVFGKPGLHISVFILTVCGNVAYFLAFRSTRKYHSEINDAQIFGYSMIESVDFYQRILTWLLSGYVVIIVQQYYRGAKEKGGLMFSSMAAIVGNISVVINDQCDGAEEFTESLWGALTSMGHYALAHAASNTKFNVSKDELRSIFDSRGLDGEYLLSFQKKETAALIYNGMMASLNRSLKRRGRVASKEHLILIGL